MNSFAFMFYNILLQYRRNARVSLFEARSASSLATANNFTLVRIN